MKVAAATPKALPPPLRRRNPQSFRDPDAGIPRAKDRRTMPPSLEHNAIVEMFRENPELAPHLLETLFHVDVPAHATTQVVESALDQLVPVEFRADLVLELRDASGGAVLAIVLEVQRQPDPDKKYAWPVYVAAVRARKRCDTGVLVVAPDASVAAWAAESIDLGLGRGHVEPLVLGPAVVPKITDPAAAEQEVELAILSAAAHGNGPNGLDVVQAALVALGRLDGEHASVYFQIVWSVLREPTRRALEALVMERQAVDKAKWLPFMEHFFELWQSATEARALLTVLRGRGIAVPDEARERILAERDPAVLERWLERAGTAATVAELLDEPS
jgi:hypothetical protein